ncbi:hypothetical protein FO519_003716 [Halicephalobus sp. NKZ332]|nr:hypothetical protein FO519_003716 [Halicephalobus sp. NKZ332]
MPRLKKQLVHLREIRQLAITRITLPDAPKMFPPTLPNKFARNMMKVESPSGVYELPASISTPEVFESKKDEKEEDQIPMKKAKHEITEQFAPTVSPSFPEIICPDLERNFPEGPPEFRRKVNLSPKKKKKPHIREFQENRDPVLPDAPRLFPPKVPTQLKSAKRKIKQNFRKKQSHLNSDEDQQSPRSSGDPEIPYSVKSSQLRCALEAIQSPKFSETMETEYPGIFGKVSMKPITKKRLGHEALLKSPILPDAPILFDPIPPRKLISQNYVDPQRFLERQLQSVLNSQS